MEKAKIQQTLELRINAADQKFDLFIYFLNGEKKREQPRFLRHV